MLARTYKISGTCDVGLRKAWGWIKEAFGFGPKKQPAAVGIGSLQQNWPRRNQSTRR